MARPVHSNPSPCLRLLSPSSSYVFRYVLLPHIPLRRSYKLPDSFRPLKILKLSSAPSRFAVDCSGKSVGETLKTCKNCKTQFDPSLNHPRACRFHTAHFGGETKRKFESVYSGGTMNTPNSGEVFQYWHCCGSEDQFDPGCTAAPHASYDDD